MNSRTTLILAVLVAILGGYYYWTQRHPKPDTDHPKLVSLDEKAVQEIRIAKGQTTVALKRDGDGWRMAQPVDAKADSSAVSSVISSLTAAKVDRTVEEKPAALADFGLDPPELMVTLQPKGGQPATLLFGKANPTASGVYAKKGDAPAVLMVPQSLKTDLDKSATDLRDKTVLALDSGKATRLEIQGQHGTIVAVKTGEAWTLEQPIQARADSYEIEKILTAVRELKAKGFVDESAADLGKYGLNKPTVRVSVLEKDAPAPKTLLVVMKPGPGTPAPPAPAPMAPQPPDSPTDAYAAVQGGGRVYLVDGVVLQAFTPTPMALRDKRLLTFDPKEIKGVRLVWTDTTIAVEKDGEGWKLTEPQAAAGPADSDKASDLLWAVDGLRFKAIIDKPADLARYGLAKPIASLVLKKTDNTELPAIEFGQVDKAKDDVYAKVKNAPAVYVLGVKDLESLPKDPARLKKEPKKDGQK